MLDLLSPPTPELSLHDLTRLAGYAKGLGKATDRARRRQRVGNHLTRLKGHGMELLEVRNYQAGDEFRHIDWRVSARTGTPHTRVYAEEQEHNRLLVLDMQQSTYFGTELTFISTRILQVMALIAWRTLLQKDRIGACLNYGGQCHQITNTRNTTNMNKLLSLLADASRVQHRTLTADSAPWQTVRQTLNPKNTQILIFSDRQHLSAEDSLHLQGMAKRNQVHWVRVTDRRALQLPDGQYALQDNTGKHSVFVSNKSRLTAQERYTLMQQTLNQALMKMGIAYHDFRLTDSPVTIARHLITVGAIS